MDVAYGARLQELVAERVRGRGEADTEWKPVLLSNAQYNNHELMGLMSHCRLLVGMRVHSLILAARAETAVVGLVYAPKVRSFLKQLETPEYACELAGLGATTLRMKIFQAWEEAPDLRRKQQRVAAELENRARTAAKMVADQFFPKNSEHGNATASRAAL